MTSQVSDAELAAVFAALADDTRRQVVRLLSEGPRRAPGRAGPSGEQNC